MKRVLKSILFVLLAVLVVGAVFVAFKFSTATSNIYLFCNGVIVENNSTMPLNAGEMQFEVMYLQDNSYEAADVPLKIQIVPNKIEKGNIKITDGEEEKSFSDLKELTSAFDITVIDNGFTINYDNSSIVEKLKIVESGNISFVHFEDNQCHCNETAFVKLVITSDDSSKPFNLNLLLHNEKSSFSVLPDCEHELSGYNNRIKCETCQNVVALGEIVPYSHTFVAGEYVAPTCTEEGRTNIRECSVCGYVDSYDIVPATGHTFGAGIVLIAPTETEVGKMEETCRVCGFKRITDIPVLSVEECSHNLIDKNDIPATCQKEGKTNIKYCTLCDQIISYDILPLADHTAVTVAATVTCGADGLSEYTKCAVCGVHLTEPTEVSKDTISHTPTVVASTATCSTGGSSEYTKCSVCGFHITEPTEVGPLSDSGHKYRAVNTMSYCADCGYSHVNGDKKISSSAIPVYVFKGGYDSNSEYVNNDSRTYLRYFNPTCSNVNSTNGLCEDYYFPYSYSICEYCGEVEPIARFSYDSHLGYSPRAFENIHRWNENFNVSTFELGDGGVIRPATCLHTGVYYQTYCMICEKAYLIEGEFTQPHSLEVNYEYFEGEVYSRCIYCGEIVLDRAVPRGVYDVFYDNLGLNIIKETLRGYKDPIIMIQSNYTWREIIENHINVQLSYYEDSAYGCPTAEYMCFELGNDGRIRAGVCSEKIPGLTSYIGENEEDWYGFLLYDFVGGDIYDEYGLRIGCGQMVEITDLDSQANGIFILQSILR